MRIVAVNNGVCKISGTKNGGATLDPPPWLRVAACRSIAVNTLVSINVVALHIGPGFYLDG